MRMVTKDIGRPLEGVCSLREFLCTMYDACVVRRNLYRKRRIFYRDISDNNIMFAPHTDEYRERCASSYAEVKFVNQVLAKDKNAQSEPACLVIDLGNGTGLKVERDRDALTERTFIVRSVSCGNLLPQDDYNSWGVAMPPMEGPREFFHVMYKHYPAPRLIDSRSRMCTLSLDYWNSILHPELANLSRMLREMLVYIRPESNAEHVHEALMRLLLTEIVRIDQSGKDISIDIDGRAIPLALD
ncbi:hypothetical protein B0J17DRAFT_304796 [Rhizoctonia solani]|nr:hypothetical protein B0J17DRAFT_304796 [Rhizoctonia solani]